jgi:hypothetical protein
MNKVSGQIQESGEYNIPRCPDCRGILDAYTFDLEYLNPSSKGGSIFHKKPFKMLNGKTRHYYYCNNKRISKVEFQTHSKQV